MRNFYYYHRQVVGPGFDSTESVKNENPLAQDLKNIVDGKKPFILALGLGLWPLVHHES